MLPALRGLTFPLRSPGVLEAAWLSHRARVQRGPSEAARCASTGPTWVFSCSGSFRYLSLGEWPRLPSTARIGRAHSDCARSASKEGAWPLPAIAMS